MRLAGRGRVPSLLGPLAALLALRFLSAFAPAEPRILGVPFGLVTELGVVVASTITLHFALRGRRPASPSP